MTAEQKVKRLRDAIEVIRAMAQNRSRVNMPSGMSLDAFCGIILEETKP